MTKEEAIRAVVEWAYTVVEHYGGSSDYQDPLHQLAAAIRDLDAITAEESK